MKRQLIIGILLSFASVAATASSSTGHDSAVHAETADKSLPPENKLVIKAFTSRMVATYACRNLIDGGNAQYHQALTGAEDAFTIATNDRAKAKMMVSVLDKRIENDDPGAQLQHQFDDVKAGPSMRKQSCEKLIRGSQQRSEDALRNYRNGNS